MKQIIRTFFMTSLPFGLILGLFTGIISGLINGLLLGIFCGTAFGLIMSIFISAQARSFRRKASEILGVKKIIYDGGANHFQGKESVGGWLYLTEDELIFQSHNLNIQNHKLTIPLDQITQAKARQTLGLVPNGLQVDTISSKEKFVVSSRNEWIKRIKLAKSAASLSCQIN